MRKIQTWGVYAIAKSYQSSRINLIFLFCFACSAIQVIGMPENQKKRLIEFNILKMQVGMLCALKKYNFFALKGVFAQMKEE